MAKTIQVASLTEYLKQVERLYKEWGYLPGALWFRGVKNIGHKLQPSVVWRKVDDEQSLVDDFLVSYVSLNDGQVENPWELYALMQHYGLPTRLLDWSKSPLVALYFAVEEEENPRTSAVVWAMDAVKLNEITCNTDGIPVPGRKQNREGIDVDAYLPKGLKEERNAELPDAPLAIETPMTNRRITAQQGCFTIHGKSHLSIDAVFQKARSDRLVRFEFKTKRQRGNILDSLRNAGLKEENIYQDLPSLTRRIIRERQES